MALTVVTNNTVLSCRLNAGSDFSDVTVSGREFQTRETATGKARSPMVVAKEEVRLMDQQQQLYMAVQ